MRREAKLLFSKACDSIVLGIELFNRPHERGRTSAVLIQTDHGFEMLLKASIIHRGGKIREKGAKETIGFDACVRRGLSDGRIKFLTEEQALTLRTINALRDAAQHHLLDISEGQFYIHIQSAITLFRELIWTVFQKQLVHELPTRVLPISTTPPTDLAAIFDSEVDEVLKLLQPGKRRRVEAEARLRPLALLDLAIRGEKEQPSSVGLRRISRELSSKSWPDVFPGAAVVEVVTEGVGPTLAIRLTNKQGPPVTIVPEGTSGASPVAVRRVDELGFYSMGAKDLAGKLSLTVPKFVAVVDHLDMRNDPDCYKEFRIGSGRFKRYSQTATGKIAAALENEGIESIWAKYRESQRKAIL